MDGTDVNVALIRWMVSSRSASRRSRRRWLRASIWVAMSDCSTRMASRSAVMRSMSVVVVI